MESVILSTRDIRQIARRVGLDALMDEMIARLTAAFRAYDERCISVPVRGGFSYENPGLGLMEWMPVMQVGGHVTIKVVGYHPANPRHRGLPSIISTVSMYDTTTGHLIGLADGTFLTALRTGATSAVASRLLAHLDSRVVGLIGAGVQAVTQLHALSRVFDLERVLVYDTDPAAARSFAARTRFLDLAVQCLDEAGLARMVREADIICTATSVDIDRGPVFADEGCKPWLHVNAVGSDFPGKFEVPLSLLRRSFVCPDFPAQAVKEGECQRLQAEEIGPALFELVQQPDRQPDLRQRETVFDSTGWALEDHVALEMLLEYAADLGLGTPTELEVLPEDPRDPYELGARVLAAAASFPG
jgi:ornithine cyclodeaminase/alanine dehydrogenase-like protein (mu-crystallin family)